MTVALTLTAAGRAALVDAAHRATQSVQIRRLAIGTGTAPAGTDESARAALRVQREIVAVTGSTAVPARIAIRADYAPSAAYSVTEVGLFARVGDAGAEFLAAYWAAPDAAGALAATVPGTALVVAGIVEITASAAEITIMPALTIQVGAPGAATTATRGLVELATAAEATAGTDTERAVTPAALQAALDALGVTMQTILTGPFLLHPQQQSQRVAETPISGYRWLDVLVATDPDANGRWSIGETVRVPVAALPERAHMQTAALLLISQRTARLIDVNPRTAAGTLLATLRPTASAGSTSDFGLAWHDGHLWWAARSINTAQNDVSVYTVDINSYTVVRVGGAGISVGGGIGLASHGGALYLASRAASTGRVEFHTVNTATGLATRRRTLALPTTGGFGMTSHAGTLYTVAGADLSLYAVDLSTGNFARRGALGAGTGSTDPGLSTARFDTWAGELAYDVVPPGAGARLEMWRRTGAANTIVFRNAGAAGFRVVQVVGVT